MASVAETIREAAERVAGRVHLSMRTRTWLRIVGQDIVFSFWFTPLLLAALGFLLASGTILFEGAIAKIPGLGFVMLPVERSVSVSIMSTIATASISATSVVYSLSLLIRSLAISTLGPRLVESFRQDPMARLALGAQLGVFVLALTALLRASLVSDVTVFLTAVALIAVVISMALLVMFVNTIAAQVRVDSIVGRVSERCIALIDEMASATPPDTPPVAWTDTTGPTVRAVEHGYVQSIDYQGIAENEALADRAVDMLVRPGEHILPGQTIARLDAGPIDDDVADAINSGIGFGAIRTVMQDPLAEFNLLLEIALRALSPGMNDVFTAISCFHHLKAAFATLDGRDLAGGIVTDEENGTRVRKRSIPFAQFVDSMVVPLQPQAAATPPMGRVMLEGFEALIETSRNETAREIYRSHAARLLRAAEALAQVEEDREELQRVWRRIVATAARTHEGAAETEDRDEAKEGTKTVAEAST